LAVQFAEQGFTVRESGAQRLIQSGHAQRLEMGPAVYQLATKNAGQWPA
jgi:hypothetical protein